MRNIVSAQTTNDFAGIYGSYGAKVFLSIFWVDNIKLAPPDDQYPKLYFVFSFEPWYYGYSDHTEMDDTEIQADTVLIAELPKYIIMAATDELGLYHIFEYFVWAIHFFIYGWFISSCKFNSHVYIMARYHGVVWYRNIYTFINIDNITRVKRRPKNTNNIFDKGDCQAFWSRGESK